MNNFNPEGSRAGRTRARGCLEVWTRPRVRQRDLGGPWAGGHPVLASLPAPASKGHAGLAASEGPSPHQGDGGRARSRSVTL